jgi:type IV secretory pathway protease TraF
MTVQKWRKTGFCLFFCCGLVLIFFAAVYMSGVRINYTSSLPQRLWIIRAIDEDDIVEHGDYALVSRQEIDTSRFGERIRADYFNGSAPLLKQIFALPGDVVGEDIDVVVLSADGKGTLLPFCQLPVKLGDDEYWLSSDRKTGFDSRYFGPVKRKAIIAKAVPIF